MSQKSRGIKNWTKKQKIRNLVIFFIVAIVLITIIGILVGNKQKAEVKDTGYTLYKIKEPDPLLFKGSVEPEKIDQIYYDQTLGKITEIHVKDGQKIDKDTVILTYQNDTQEDAVDENENARAKLATAVENARSTLNTSETRRNNTQNKLNQAKNKANSNNEMEAQEGKAEVSQYESALEQAEDGITQAQQALNSAQSDLDSANQSIEKSRKKVTTKVSAPNSGIAFVSPEGKNTPTTPVIQIVSPEIKVKGQVSEYDYRRLATDQEVTVKPISTKDEIKGKITYISQLPETVAKDALSAAGATSSGLVNYQFNIQPEKVIQYGYSVQISLPLHELRIPEKAIKKDGNSQYVYVYKNGKAKKQVIEGEEKNGYFVLNTGLSKGDKIIENPDGKLKDGQDVSISS